MSSDKLSLLAAPNSPESDRIMGAYLLQQPTANVTYDWVTEASYGLSICTPMTSDPYRVWCHVSYSCLSFVSPFVRNVFCVGSTACMFQHYDVFMYNVCIMYCGCSYQFFKFILQSTKLLSLFSIFNFYSTGLIVTMNNTFFLQFTCILLDKYSNTYGIFWKLCIFLGNQSVYLPQPPATLLPPSASATGIHFLVPLHHTWCKSVFGLISRLLWLRYTLSLPVRSPPFLLRLHLGFIFARRGFCCYLCGHIAGLPSVAFDLILVSVICFIMIIFDLAALSD